MKFYKDYHFYIAISGFVVLLIVLLAKRFGIEIENEIAESFVAYGLSLLIAYNIININVNKDKKLADIQADIQKSTEIAKNLLGTKSVKNCKSECENTASEQEQNERQENIKQTDI